MIYFTSDTHFFHKNILEYCPERKNFASSVEEMNDILIQRWNSKVNHGDDVYFFGDFIFNKNPETIKATFGALKGNIYFIKGNHDDKQVTRNLSVPVMDSVMFNLDGVKIYLNHYPNSTKAYEKFNFMLCGHVHDKWDQKRKFEIVNGNKCWTPMINVGVDVRDYEPISLDEVMEIWKQIK